MNGLNFKDISGYIIIAIICACISHVLGTVYLLDYLEKNLLTIQIALMAVTTTIRGLIVSKLQEIKIKFPETSIKPITQTLLFSFKEQIGLVIVSTFLVIIINSKILTTLIYDCYFSFIAEVLVYTCFIYAIDILYDTGKAIFVLVDILDDLNDHPNQKK